MQQSEPEQIWESPTMALRRDCAESPDTGGLGYHIQDPGLPEVSVRLLNSQSMAIGTSAPHLYLCVSLSHHSPHGTVVSSTEGIGNVSLFISHLTCLDQYEGKGPHICSESQSWDHYMHPFAALCFCSGPTKTIAPRFKRKGRGDVEWASGSAEIPWHILPRSGH